MFIPVWLVIVSVLIYVSFFISASKAQARIKELEETNTELKQTLSRFRFETKQLKRDVKNTGVSFLFGVAINSCHQYNRAETSKTVSDERKEETRDKFLKDKENVERAMIHVENSIEIFFENTEA
ncbi:hypothetical protein FYF33_20140 [Salmonella enterica]|nr:hypothetical protein [Salmonella enterica]